MGLKDAKKEFIIGVAANLFMQRGISEVTIKDIADKAGVGEATIYRYFVKKTNIVIATAMSLRQNVYCKYFDLSKGKNGFEKIEIFYDSYLSIFKDSSSYYYFIKEFDAYMCAEKKANLQDYEKGVDEFKAAYLSAYKEGVEDGSIKEVKNVDVFYFSTTHALLELCKKLSMSKGVLTQDKTLKKASEIKCLIKIILEALRNC